MPTPYETLIKAASRLEVSDAGPLELQRLSEADLQAILKPNLSAYEQARATLPEKPRLAERNGEDLSPQKLEKERSHLGNLSRYLRADAQLALVRGDFAELSRIGLCQLELAHVIRSGGNPNDSLVSLACRTAGIGCMVMARDRIDDATRHEAIQCLVEWEKDLLPHVDPFNYRPAGMESASDTIDAPPKDEAPTPLDSLHGRILAQTRMLVIDLALRCYQETKGQYPQRLTELETILPEGIPLDPFTDAPFTYRLEGNQSFHLYSLGPSGVDHGGSYGGIDAVNAGQADLCLDVNDYGRGKGASAKPIQKKGTLRQLLDSLRRRCGSWITRTTTSRFRG